MRYISVKFEMSNTQYTYFTRDNSIVVGDEVVVITPTGTKIARVYQVDCPSVKATKPIVCKVDKAAYEKEVSNIANARRLQELIDARVEYLLRGSQLEALAKTDSALASLLEQKKAYTQ